MSDVERFLDDAFDYFDGSYTAMHSIDRDVLARLQLEGMKARFDQLRDRIPFLKKLADGNGITELTAFDDVVGLLFEHTVYKSYPASLLANNRFDQITKWLSKLTTCDLSTVDTAGCEGIDDWFDRLDAQSPLTPCHSSGTTGTVSFIPWSKVEMDKKGRHFVIPFQNFGDPRPAELTPDVDVIFPSYRYGGSSHFRNCEAYLKYLAKGDESRFHVAFDEKMSADVLYLAGRIRAAKAKGDLDRVEIPASQLTRLQAYEHNLRDRDERLRDFLDDVTRTLAGKRVVVRGAFTYVYPWAQRSIESGKVGVFSPDSIVSSGGGAKGIEQPVDWRETVARFAGIPVVDTHYGMTEVAGIHRMCTHGNFHIVPWVIPYVLDPDTSKPLPRTGRVTGRAAFFDLLTDSHWGGFISGDEVTINWDKPCECGMTSVYLDPVIGRYSDKKGGDDKISCAASAEAHEEAMEFLSEYALH